jgi:hypothetical protein
MNSNEDLTNPSLPTRRKFVFVVGIVALFATLSRVMKTPFANRKNNIQCKSGTNNMSTAMLTQDGRLVQVDNALITTAGKKASNREMQNWLKK